METGIGLDPTLRLTMEEQRALVREAMGMGYTSAWTPAGATGRDAFHVCSQWAAAGAPPVPGASGIGTGISVVPVSHWTATQLAATAGTVGELAGGRFVLGVGTGGAYVAAQQEAYGQPAYPPLALMRDHLVVLRRLLAGERVDYEGETLVLRGVRLAFSPPRVPVYLGALGPQMVRLAGEAADGVCLNWCNPERVAWSRRRAAEGSRRAGRDPSEVRLMEYIRICVDEDTAAARRALARATLGYAMARPGASPALGYRAHFARMGFEAALSTLEARRDAGASDDDLAAACPDDLLLSVGYFGAPAGAGEAFRRLAEGLDVAVVRVVPSRPGADAVATTLRACRPV
jgi:alkanesulfonate monooxygenase SsuD/methylene tetrahydromethanopterin reductase-like flavin-dependent oxidoreductase (luciferase family)